MISVIGSDKSALCACSNSKMPKDVFNTLVEIYVQHGGVR